LIWCTIPSPRPLRTKKCSGFVRTVGCEANSPGMSLLTHIASSFATLTKYPLARDGLLFTKFQEASYAIIEKNPPYPSWRPL